MVAPAPAPAQLLLPAQAPGRATVHGPVLMGILMLRLAMALSLLPVLGTVATGVVMVRAQVQGRLLPMAAIRPLAVPALGPPMVVDPMLSVPVLAQLLVLLPVEDPLVRLLVARPLATESGLLLVRTAVALAVAPVRRLPQVEVDRSPAVAPPTVADPMLSVPVVAPPLIQPPVADTTLLRAGAEHAPARTATRPRHQVAARRRAPMLSPDHRVDLMARRARARAPVLALPPNPVPAPARPQGRRAPAHGPVPAAARVLRQARARGQARGPLLKRDHMLLQEQSPAPTELHTRLPTPALHRRHPSPDQGPARGLLPVEHQRQLPMADLALVSVLTIHGLVPMGDHPVAQ